MIKAAIMNKKPARTGPRIRITKPAFKTKKIDEVECLRAQDFEGRKYVYSCQYCRLRFSQNSQYFRHMTSNHEVQQRAATFQCNDCQIVFTKKSNLDMHCQTHHLAKSKSKCESCSITFKSRYCLRRHLKLKQLLSENACIKCHKKFTSKEGLTKHIKNKHMYKNTTYQCDLCSLKFKAEESLQSHSARVHKKL